jgi:hypothetical protein
MLTREMSHRVKNLFAIAIGMGSISSKSGNPDGSLSGKSSRRTDRTHRGLE